MTPPALAAKFTAANSEYLSHAGNATLRGSATGWWRAGWLYLDSLNTWKTLFSTLAGNDGIRIRVSNASKLRCEAGDGSAVQSVIHTSAFSADTWYFWYAEYDGTDLNISFNDGTPVSAGASFAFSPGAQVCLVGGGIGPIQTWDGGMQSLCGDDGTLSAANITALYAAGAGLAYCAKPSGVLPGADGFWFNLDEESDGSGAVTREDSHGSNHLTDNNTVTSVARVA